MMCSARSWFAIVVLAFVSVSDLSAQEQSQITGRVVDETGQPLSAAAVSSAATRVGTLTRADGTYVLEVEPGEHTIQVTMLGYATQSASATVAAGQEVTLDFTLARDALALQEIVVTGTRTARPQQEATVAIGVITREQLQRAQPQSVAEALRSIPGFHAEEGGGEVAVNAFVRGLPSPGGFQYVTLQEDGMPIRSIPDAGAAFSVEDVFFRQDLNVRSVEVAKGGASTLFGVNAPGGIINYRSRTGGDVLRSTLKFTAGQTDLYRLDFNTNGPLGEDYRFNVGGFYRYDEGPRRSGLPTEGLQLKGNLTRLLDRGRLRFHFKYLDDKVQFFLPIAHNSQTLEPAIRPEGTHNSAAAADFAVPTPNDGLFRSTMGNGVLTRGMSAMIEYASEFGDGWSIENKARWSDWYHEFNIFIPFVAESPDSVAAPYLTNPGDRAVYSFANTGGQATPKAVMPQGVWALIRPTKGFADQLTVRKQLEAGDWQQELSLGMYVSRSDLTGRQIQPTMLFELADRPRALDLSIEHANGDVTQVTADGGILEAGNNYRNSEALANNVSIFGGDAITLNSGLRIDIGARYQRQVTTVRVEDVERYDLGPTLAEQNVAGGTGHFTRRRLSFDDFGAALGLNYAVADGFNLYGSASRGFVFPPLSTFTGDVRIDEDGDFVQPQPEDNEEFLQAELGVRLASSQFSGTMSGYWVQINNRLQTQIRIVDGVALDVTDAVGETRTFGIEAAGAYSPTAMPGLTLESSITLQDHAATDFMIGEDDFSGNAIKRVPDVMLTNSLAYEWSDVDLWLNWNHVGPRFADDANLFELPAFDIFSANLGYVLPVEDNRSVRADINVYNLFNSAGLTEGDPRLAADVDPTALPFLNARPILPRRIKVSVAYTF